MRQILEQPYNMSKKINIKNFDIFALCDPYLYCLAMPGEENLYELFMDNVEDLGHNTNYFEKHNHLMIPYWPAHTGIPADDTSGYARRLRDEALELESELDDLIDNCDNQTQPDLDDFFKPLEEVPYPLSYHSMKSYGSFSPSMIRIYALKIEDNCYLIIGCGIKITRAFQDSPGLENVWTWIEEARDFLKRMKIIDQSSLEEISKQ